METISISGAEIYYDRSFLPAEEATILFNILLTKCAWQRHRSSFKYAVPRDEACTMAILAATTHIRGASTSRSPGFRRRRRPSLRHIESK
jgi:hypothetical protein